MKEACVLGCVWEKRVGEEEIEGSLGAQRGWETFARSEGPPMIEGGLLGKSEDWQREREQDREVKKRKSSMLKDRNDETAEGTCVWPGGVRGSGFKGLIQK